MREALWPHATRPGLPIRDTTPTDRTIAGRATEHRGRLRNKLDAQREHNGKLQRRFVPCLPQPWGGAGADSESEHPCELIKRDRLVLPGIALHFRNLLDMSPRTVHVVGTAGINRREPDEPRDVLGKEPETNRGFAGKRLPRRHPLPRRLDPGPQARKARAPGGE